MTGRRLALLAVILVGIGLGIGAFTFVYARGASYLGNNPETCANCHIMRDHLDAWLKSSHRNVATCNDCHAPHDLVGKYSVKARNGFWHSFYFTTGNYPDPLRITPKNQQVTEGSCRYCHEEITEVIEHGAQPDGDEEKDRLRCARCHVNVGHWVR